MYFLEFLQTMVSTQNFESKFQNTDELKHRKYPLSQPGISSAAQPSECGRQDTLISVHAQTAAWQQSNGNSEARMSEKCGEWRD